MYTVIVPTRVWLEIRKELEFWSKKSQQYGERIAVILDFHLTKTLVINPGFGALRAKKPELLYYLIEKQFKLVIEIDELHKHVIVHHFFNTRKAISEYI